MERARGTTRRSRIALGRPPQTVSLNENVAAVGFPVWKKDRGKCKSAFSPVHLIKRSAAATIWLASMGKTILIKQSLLRGKRVKEHLLWGNNDTQSTLLVPYFGSRKGRFLQFHPISPETEEETIFDFLPHELLSNFQRL